MINLEEIKKFLSDFLDISGFINYEIDCKSNEEDKLIEINLRLEESGVLIGTGGRNLEALEQILRVVINKKIGSEWRLFLDINNYRQNQEEELKEFARKMARQAILNHQEISLPPMTSRQRRVIHLELAFNSEVTTESIGEGKERHIVIKPRG